MSENIDKQEEFLLAMIQTIQERHYKELKPWFDKLCALRDLRITPVRLTGEQYKKWFEMSLIKEQEDESIDSNKN